MGARTMSSCELYTSKPFVKGNDARKVVENALQTVAKADRAQLLKDVEDGADYDTELSALLTDANFNAWLNRLRLDLASSVIPEVTLSI